MNESFYPKLTWLLNGRCFAYELERASFEGDDCRFPTTLEELPWTRCELNAGECAAINAFMGQTGYSFGRLDFLRANGKLWFLELNPNGQFAWLDPHGAHGLLAAVAGGIRRVWAENGGSAGG